MKVKVAPQFRMGMKVKKGVALLVMKRIVVSPELTNMTLVFHIERFLDNYLIDEVETSHFVLGFLSKLGEKRRSKCLSSTKVCG